MSTKLRTALPAEGNNDLPDGSVFRTAFDSSLTAMFLLDPQDGAIINANPAACAFYGYAPEELGDLPIAQVSLLPQDDILALLRKISAEGAARFASRHRLKNGELRDMEMDAAPITLRSGRKCVFFIAHDVTPLAQAERTLRQREGLLRAILNSADDSIGFKDTSGVYREANPAFFRLVGQNCEELLGRKTHAAFDRRIAELHMEMDRRAMSERSLVVYEMELDFPEGPRHLSVHKSPVFDASGECLGVVFINRDTTDQRTAEAALRKSEGLLRAMLESAQDSIFVTDEDDVLREANQTFCRHIGREREDLLDRALFEVFEDDELRIQLSTSALARETRGPVNFTQRIQRPGLDLWINVVKTAIIDVEGRCLGVVSMGRDITEQKTAQTALRRSERRLSSLIRQAPVGVFETDSKGLLVFANERMQRQTGRPLETLLGIGWTDSIHPEDRPEFLHHWQLTLDQRRELDRELRVLNPRGAQLWVSCRIRPMRDSASRITGYLGVLGDITDRKKAEALRTDVESVVRHDLKSPLGSVQNALELLQMLGPLNMEQSQVLSEVRILTRRMLGLIALSVDLHAMEAGVFVPKPESLDLCAVLEDLRAELRPLVEGKSLRLEIASSCGQEPFFVLGERRLVDAVFSNLLKNAAEASPEGGEIQVRLWTEGREAVASIRNLGTVPQEIRGRFFEKYATAGKAHGTGLGTYSARLMVRTLGGRVTLDTSEPDATTLIVHMQAPQQSIPATET